MKKNSFLIILCLTCLLIGLVNACKKDSSIIPPTNIGTAISFTEEFDSVYKLETKGWIMDKYARGSIWTQGAMGGYSKSGGVAFGFTAYSYTTSRDEYAYA